MVRGLCPLSFGTEYRPQQKKEGGGNNSPQKVHENIVHIKAASHNGLDQFDENCGTQSGKNGASPAC